MMTQTNPFDGVQTVEQMERPNPDGPTAKQVDLLERLLHETGCNVRYEVEAIQDAGKWNRRGVSVEIEALLAERGERKAARDNAVPLGLHEIDGEVYKVQRSQGGNVYAKRLVQTGEGGWQYVGREPLANLSESTVLTRDVASAIGRRIGICCVCGALLTNEVSVREGIGPICGGRL